MDPLDEALLAQHREYLDSFKPVPWDGSRFQRQREDVLKHMRDVASYSVRAMQEDMANQYIAGTGSKREYEDFVRRYQAGVARYGEDWITLRDKQLAALESEALAAKLRHEIAQEEVPYWPYDPHPGVAGAHRGPLEIRPEEGE